MSVLRDPKLEVLLDRLHGRSEAEARGLADYFARRAREGSLDRDRFDADVHRFLGDKLVALDRDKAELGYLLCRALQARRVVEAGTSFGVSTLYLAAAVRDVVGEPGRGVVIGTEYEPAKAAAARAHFAEAGLAEFIDLREGDTLRDPGGPVDFLLLDVWTPMARPALERVAPYLRPGALVACDNTTQFRDEYADLLAFASDPANGLRGLTLPYAGGFELLVRA